ncbi:MAG TPA: galactokinase, partial [Balneolaceae bacterium]|nr:galactokinase [Balneolaceae bacterium]
MKEYTGADLIQIVIDEFKSRFKKEPVLVASPGRVNLIGDHTDYNDGFVLPAAIDKKTVLGISPNGMDKVRAFSIDMNESVQLQVAHPKQSKMQWANYLKGVICELKEKGYSLGGFDVVFSGDIPIGAGLSSSAALEGALLIGLTQIFDLNLNRSEMARIGQLTEHNHVGVQCGIMDQFVNLHGVERYALKLDCRSLEFEQVPFERDDIKVVLCNSKVSHNLADSEYNVRRAQCEQGVEVLKKYDAGIQNLRDVSRELLEDHKSELNELIFRRCKFVLDENERVHAACKYLAEDDLEAFGKCMFDSHEGLSKEYEVSCRELDVLVE